MNPIWVYVLKSEINGRHYIGSTENWHIRLQQHNRGLCRSTKAYRPWNLIYKEKFSSRTEARKRENFFKTGVGRKILKEQILKTDVLN